MVESKSLLVSKTIDSKLPDQEETSVKAVFLYSEYIILILILNFILKGMWSNGMTAL